MRKRYAPIGSRLRGAHHSRRFKLGRQYDRIPFGFFHEINAPKANRYGSLESTESRLVSGLKWGTIY
jgi:hypothetical protein